MVRVLVGEGAGSPATWTRVVTLPGHEGWRGTRGAELDMIAEAGTNLAPTCNIETREAVQLRSASSSQTRTTSMPAPSRMPQRVRRRSAARAAGATPSRHALIRVTPPEAAEPAMLGRPARRQRDGCWGLGRIRVTHPGATQPAPGAEPAPESAPARMAHPASACGPAPQRSLTLSRVRLSFSRDARESPHINLGSLSVPYTNNWRGFLAS